MYETNRKWKLDSIGSNSLLPFLILLFPSILNASFHFYTITMICRTTTYQERHLPPAGSEALPAGSEALPAGSEAHPA